LTFIRNVIAIILLVIAAVLIGLSEWLVLWAGKLDLETTKIMTSRLLVEINGGDK